MDGGHMNRRLLVIDDDSGLLALLSIGLAREGFEVITAKDGKEGLRLAYERHPDVVLLDVLMEGMDGWTTLQRLRQVTDVPVLILSAVTDSGSVVRGLSLGADDYIAKPCSFDVLKARVRAALRRRGDTASSDPESIFDDGNLRIDLAEQTVTRHGEPVHLTPTELRLLMYLVGHRDQIVTHRELLTNVWGPEYANETKYLGVYIRYVRQKVEDDPSNPNYVITKPRVGYCFMDRTSTEGGRS
jgi:two-component system, OmpR family, KDP operon response regulator KdpE